MSFDTIEDLTGEQEQAKEDWRKDGNKKTGRGNKKAEEAEVVESDNESGEKPVDKKARKRSFFAPLNAIGLLKIRENQRKIADEVGVNLNKEESPEVIADRRERIDMPADDYFDALSGLLILYKEDNLTVDKTEKIEKDLLAGKLEEQSVENLIEAGEDASHR